MGCHIDDTAAVGRALFKRLAVCTTDEIVDVARTLLVPIPEVSSDLHCAVRQAIIDDLQQEGQRP